MASLEQIDALVAAWRSNPDAGRAIAVCRALAVNTGSASGPFSNTGESDRRRLLVQVAPHIATRHGDSYEVLLALGALYLTVGTLMAADGALKKALALVPADPRAWRLIGEVFLRAGNARDAERAFLGAIARGQNDASTESWLGRARSYIHVQDAHGAPTVESLVSSAIRAQIAQPPHQPVDEITSEREKIDDDSTDDGRTLVAPSPLEQEQIAALRAHVGSAPAPPAADVSPPAPAPVASQPRFDILDEASSEGERTNIFFRPEELAALDAVSAKPLPAAGRAAEPTPAPAPKPAQAEAPEPQGSKAAVPNLATIDVTDLPESEALDLLGELAREAEQDDGAEPAGSAAEPEQEADQKQEQDRRPDVVGKPAVEAKKADAPAVVARAPHPPAPGIDRSMVIAIGAVLVFLVVIFVLSNR